MGQFDQTAWLLVKMDGAAFLAFALSLLARRPGLVFAAWDDTRRLVIPGEPDRTNDLVARVLDEGGVPGWLIAEIEDEAEPGIFWRAGQYEMHLGREVNPTCDPGGPHVFSLVLNLSGTQRAPRLESGLAGGQYGTRIAPMVVDLAAADAIAGLEKVERGELGLTNLPFLALMKGGGEPTFIERWKKAVEREADEHRRLVYKDSAMVFADLTPRQVNWVWGTEGWMARESSYIKGWMDKGEEKGEHRNKREYHLLAIGARLQDPVPDSIRLAVEGTNDPATLDRWYLTALSSGSLADLRQAMKIGA